MDEGCEWCGAFGDHNSPLRRAHATRWRIELVAKLAAQLCAPIEHDALRDKVWRTYEGELLMEAAADLALALFCAADNEDRRVFEELRNLRPDVVEE